MRLVLSLVFLLSLEAVAQGQIPIPQTPEEVRLDDETCRRAGYQRRSGAYKRCRNRLAWRRDEIKRPEVLSGLCIFNGWPGTAQHRCCHSQRAGYRDVVACEAFADTIRKEQEEQAKKKRECEAEKARVKQMRDLGIALIEPMC